MRKKVLVYPCGTEIGLEVYKAVCNSIHFELYGGSSSYDHGRFVYENHIDNLPFIRDNSSRKEIEEFNRQIEEYGFDYIYPAMDGVITVFSKYRDVLTPCLVAPDFETNEITRSKYKTLKAFEGLLPTPELYETDEEISKYPVFMKPDVGQGSVGTMKIESLEELKKQDKTGKLVLEYLSGEEYTIDCFTNGNGELLFAKGRGRRRIKSGISVNAIYCENPLFEKYARIINKKLKQKGAWFFQLREAEDGTLKLLEIASRIAGTSAITRNLGVNLPLLTLNVFDGQNIDSVMPNAYEIELDRAFENKYRLELNYDAVYVDYDDTLILEKNNVNVQLIKFLYQCVNNKKPIYLITKHIGDLEAELKEFRISELFDKVIHISREEQKIDYITNKNAIFIDDSYNERRMIREKYEIPVFDTHMIECLLED